MSNHRISRLTCFALTLSWSALSAAQGAAAPAAAAPAAAAPAAATAPPAAASPTNTPSEAAAAATPASAASAEPPVWKQAMTLYELGQVDESLAMLREQVLACGDAGAAACEDSERAALYMCVGIVLSGGQANHNGGVQAFKKALSLDETMRVAPDYSTAPVQKAFTEARGVEVAVPEPVTAPVVQDIPAPNNEDEDEDAPYDPNKKRIFLLAAGGAKYGFVDSYDYDGYYEEECYYDDFDDCYYGSSGGARGISQLGGSLAVGGMPGSTSGFTIGARFRGGALFVRDTIGYVGGHIFLGGTMGPRVNNRFFFIGGGAGFESYPSFEQSALTGHFMAAGSLGGFLLSGGLDLAVGDRLTYVLFGIEVGYGGLL